MAALNFLARESFWIFFVFLYIEAASCGYGKRGSPYPRHSPLATKALHSASSSSPLADADE